MPNAHVAQSGGAFIKVVVTMKLPGLKIRKNQGLQMKTHYKNSLFRTFVSRLVHPEPWGWSGFIVKNPTSLGDTFIRILAKEMHLTAYKEAWLAICLS